MMAIICMGSEQARDRDEGNYRSTKSFGDEMMKGYLAVVMKWKLLRCMITSAER